MAMVKFLPGGGGIGDSGSNAEAAMTSSYGCWQPRPLPVDAPYCGRRLPDGDTTRLTPERLLHSGRNNHRLSCSTAKEYEMR